MDSPRTESGGCFHIIICSLIIAWSVKKLQLQDHRSQLHSFHTDRLSNAITHHQLSFNSLLLCCLFANNDAMNSWFYQSYNEFMALRWWHLWRRATQRDQLSQTVSPPGHVMWFFMPGHLQHPVSPVGFVKTTDVGGEQRGELQGQAGAWPWKP